MLENVFKKVDRQNKKITFSLQFKWENAYIVKDMHASSMIAHA